MMRPTAWIPSARPCRIPLNAPDSRFLVIFAAFVSSCSNTPPSCPPDGAASGRTGPTSRHRNPAWAGRGHGPGGSRANTIRCSPCGMTGSTTDTGIPDVRGRHGADTSISGPGAVPGPHATTGSSIPTTHPCSRALPVPTEFSGRRLTPDRLRRRVPPALMPFRGSTQLLDHSPDAREATIG